MLKDVEVGKKVLPLGEPVSNKASNTFNIHINIKKNKKLEESTKTTTMAPPC